MSRATRSRSTTRSALSTEQRASSIPPQKYYTVLSVETPDPFGFGSASPARQEPRYLDTPGPGKYDPHQCQEHFESIRGRTSGFTSVVPRKLGFTRGTKNPAPTSYDPKRPDRRIKPKIGSFPRARRFSCYPDERETSTTPGPGEYNLPPLQDRCVTSIFKSKAERVYLPAPHKDPPRFDGRVFTLRRNDMK